MQPQIKSVDEHLAKIQHGICEQAKLPLDKARALPREAYTDQCFFEWEKQNLLKKQWLCVGHVSQVPGPGDYLNLDMLDERMSVVRDKNNTIRVLSRICAHRGMDIMPPEFNHPEQGNCQQFRCPYHHWVYSADGSLKGAPFMKDHDDVVNRRLKLHEFKSEVWQGFIFVNISGSC